MKARTTRGQAIRRWTKRLLLALAILMVGFFIYVRENGTPIYVGPTSISLYFVSSGYCIPETLIGAVSYCYTMDKQPTITKISFWKIEQERYRLLEHASYSGL